MGWLSPQTCWVWAEQNILLFLSLSPLPCPRCTVAFVPPWQLDLCCLWLLSELTQCTVLAGDWQEKHEIIPAVTIPFSKTCLCPHKRQQVNDCRCQWGDRHLVQLWLYKPASFSSQNRFHCTQKLQLSPVSWRLPKYIIFSMVNFPHWVSSQNV